MCASRSFTCGLCRHFLGPSKAVSALLSGHYRQIVFTQEARQDLHGGSPARLEDSSNVVETLAVRSYPVSKATQCR